MTEIKLRKGETVETALKRLKDAVTKEGTLDECRRLRAFETPKEKLIRKARRNAKMAKLLRGQHSSSHGPHHSSY